MRYLAFLLMGVMSLPASALTKVNLYKTQVTIDQTQENADAEARQLGMQEVIIRATGDKNSPNNEVIQKALGKYNSYLNQFSYSQVGESSVMTIEFGAPQIRSLITQAQLPFWSENRANLLVWLVEESSYDRSISWEHSDSSLLQQLRATAAARGLPITVPVGDFDDITGVEISDLWGGFVKPISLASDRYPTDAILVVRAQGNDLRWTLYDQNAYDMLNSQKAPMTGRASGSTSAAEMIDQISDYYARKNAVVVGSESSQTVMATFSAIEDADDFFRLEKRLKGLNSVASLDILKIQGAEVTFDVHLLASETEFEQEVLRIAQVQKAEPPQQPQPVLEEPRVEEPGLITEPVVNTQTEEGVVVEDAVIQAEAGDAEQMTQTSPSASLTEPSEVELVTPETTTLYFRWLD